MRPPSSSIPTQQLLVTGRSDLKKKESARSRTEHPPRITAITLTFNVCPIPSFITNALVQFFVPGLGTILRRRCAHCTPHGRLHIIGAPTVVVIADLLASIKAAESNSNLQIRGAGPSKLVNHDGPPPDKIFVQFIGGTKVEPGIVYDSLGVQDTAIEYRVFKALKHFSRGIASQDVHFRNLYDRSNGAPTLECIVIGIESSYLIISIDEDGIPTIRQLRHSDGLIASEYEGVRVIDGVFHPPSSPRSPP
ncbi:hypothetical protein F5890DRAFT_1556973 [Lentinula detonsa]|uniref:Uncharacterized protein n=1 Tax=Lentinula detonsa TaxID=2804962 RepID=A0AA38UPJ6_9AGAR|nr:hypothetical protein F5890DRAFT_1556973 [Lentinula detonsa]